MIKNMIHLHIIYLTYLSNVYRASTVWLTIYNPNITSMTSMIDAARMSLVQPKRVYYINITVTPNP